jgi:hypothetical protein
MKCERCQVEHSGTYGSGRFCTVKCARSFSTASTSEKRSEINKRVSATLTQPPKVATCCMCNTRYETRHQRSTCCSKECRKARKAQVQHNVTREQRIELGIKSSFGKYVRNPTSLYDLSNRTISKILTRLGIGCSLCGWSAGKCDIHHIRGRKIEEADRHENLAYVCPNCHRLIHNKKIKIDSLVSLQDQIGDRWKELYYG